MNATVSSSSSSSAAAPATDARESTLGQLATSALFSVVTIVMFGLLYPLVIWGLSTALFHRQAEGSLVERNGAVVGSAIVAQNFAAPKYFHPRPSAAGSKGYDPTSTGGTNFGPTSKKLVDATKAAVAALRKDNPAATGPIPADLVASSASGIDPDISPEGAEFQAARVAKARSLPLDRVEALIAEHTRQRTLGILGEPRVNVLELNLALDGAAAR